MKKWIKGNLRDSSCPQGMPSNENPALFLSHHPEAKSGSCSWAQYFQDAA
jgi:hypothetical protein